MTPENLKRKIRGITIWKRGYQRAPHKPLLLLYALARCAHGQGRWIPYAEIDRELRKLLLEFGPERKSCHPEYPFWRLQRDGIWELRHAENVKPGASGNVRKTDLLRFGVEGGFTRDAFELLAADRSLITEVALEILLQHFPTSVFDDILSAVGLEFRFDPALHRKRDPAFRDKVLMAYEYRCAVCGYDVRLGPRQIALEAAHIKWHQAGGPDAETNGLALCTLHHKLFDRGAYTLNEDRIILVSQRAHGSIGFSEWLMAFHSRRLRPPQSTVYLPGEAYLSWHRREVFRGPGRALTASSGK